MQFAEDHPVDRIVLLSPFTSLADMVRISLVVGWCRCCDTSFLKTGNHCSWCWNVTPVPAILIAHGTRDEVVPVQMGRELASLNQEKIEYLEIPDRSHNDILSKLWPRLQQEFSADL